MGRKLAVIMASSGLLAACLGTSEVVKTAPDTYLVIGHADSGLHSGQGPLAAAKRANEFCVAQGREAEMIEMKTRGIPGLTEMDTDYTFKCATRKDGN